MGQTSMPADGYLSDTGRTTAQMQQAFEDMASVIMELVGGAAEGSVSTLASDTLALSTDKAVYPVQPETGTADNLATISTSGARNGSVVVVRNYSNSNTITIKHGTGNVYLADGADYAINNTGDYIAFTLRSTSWYEIFRVEANRIKVLPGQVTETTATIASGMLPLTQALNKVEGEGSASDNLDGISSTFTGNLIVLRATNASHVITVRNNQSVSAGYYKILTLDGASVTLDSLTKYVILHKDVAGTAWREVARGGAPMPLSAMPTAALLPQNVRIYPTAGSPFEPSVSSSIKIGPFGGNVISLPDSSGDLFTSLSFSESSVSIAGYTMRLLDVFAYNNAGTAAFEVNPWDASQTTGTITGASIATSCVLTSNNSLTSGDRIAILSVTGTVGTDSKKGLNNKVFVVASATGTTITLRDCDTTSLAYTSGGTWYKIPDQRDTALTYRNGLYLKSTGAKDRLYLGTIFVASGTTGVFVAGVPYCHVWNQFNKTEIALTHIPVGTGSSSHTYTTATTRPFGLNTSDRITIAWGAPNSVAGSDYFSSAQISVRQKCSSSAAGADFFAGYQAPTSSYGTAYGHTSVANQAVYAQGVVTVTPYNKGVAVFQYVENGSGGTTLTWSEGAENLSYIEITWKW